MTILAFLRDNARFLISGMLMTLNSSFGQTFFIAIFAAQIMQEFALTNGGWGLLYTLGTTVSAVVMFWAGALTDRFRARTIAMMVMPALAAVCIFMGLNGSVAGLLLAVFLLRVLGQGMMSQIAGVSMARWFARRRGLALSVATMGFAIGQAAFPVAAAALLLRFDWHLIWYFSAAFVLLCCPLIVGLLSRERTPQSLADTPQSTGMGGRHWTRREVLSSHFFWMLVPMLLGPSAWGTALFFQQVHIAEVKGWPLVEYLALIPLLTIVSVVSTIVTGQLIDRLGSGRLLQVYPVAWLLGFALLAGAGTLGVAGFAFVIFGVAHGMAATLIVAFWAEYYGTRHIGAIKASSTSLMVFGSAIGPGISGVLIDLGYPFPDQMLAIVVYFAIAGVLVWIAVERARPLLPLSKVDVESA